MKKRISTLTLMLLWCVSIAALAACGGGTTGTDGGSTTRILGNVTFQTGEPLAGGNVTLLETGDRSTIDPAGNFEIEKASLKDEVTLLIEFAGTEVQTTSLEVANGQNVLALQLVVTQKSDGLEIVELSIVPLSDTAPAPTPISTVINPKPTSTPGSSDRRPRTPVATPSPTPTPAQHILKGTVVDRNNLPLSSVAIVLPLDNGQITTSTDGSGTFAFPVENHVNVVHLLLAYSGSRSDVTVANLPSIPSLIQLKIRLTSFPVPVPTPGEPSNAASSNNAEVVSVDFIPLG